MRKSKLNFNNMEVKKSAFYKSNHPINICKSDFYKYLCGHKVYTKIK